MCGIIGLASTAPMKDWQQRKAFIMQGLYADAVRGWDSTGFFAVPTKTYETNYDGVVIRKKAVSSMDFLDMTKVVKPLNEIEKFNFVVGHNRAATKGGVSNATAHPFQHGPITLVHNGTLHSHYSLPEGNKFSVDSEAICYALSQMSAKEVIKELRGAFTLVWHDARTNKLHAVRNNERPFSFASVKDQDIVLFASEWKMLDWLADRNDLDIEDIYDLEPGQLMTFNTEKAKEYTIETVDLAPKKQPTGNRGTTTASTTGTTNGNKTAGGKRFQNSEAILKKFDLKEGDKAFFTAEKFVSYASISGSGAVPEWGYIKGTLDNVLKPHEVRIEGLKASEWDWILDARITAKVAKGYHCNRGSVDCVIVNTLDTKAIYWDDIADGDVIDAGSGVPQHDLKTGMNLTAKEWHAIANKGCAVCDGPIRIHQRDVVGWQEDGKAVCPDCMKEFKWDQLQ